MLNKEVFNDNIKQFSVIIRQISEITCQENASVYQSPIVQHNTLETHILLVSIHNTNHACNVPKISEIIKFSKSLADSVHAEIILLTQTSLDFSIFISWSVQFIKISPNLFCFYLIIRKSKV